MVLLFQTVFFLSIIGSLVYGIVSLFLLATKNAKNAFCRYGFHLVVLVFLLIPFWLFPGFFSTEKPITIPVPTAIMPTIEATPIFSPKEETMKAPAFDSDIVVPMQPTYLSKQTLLQVCALLWLCGIIVLLGQRIVQWIRLQSHMKKRIQRCVSPELSIILENAKKEFGIKRSIALYETQSFHTPFLMGLFRLKLILPQCIGELTEQQLYYVMKHECCHAKQHDLLLRLIALFLQAVHWFNPIVWLWQKELISLSELACDQRVTKDFSQTQRKDYGQTILQIMSFPGHSISGHFCTGLFQSKNAMKRRLSQMMFHTKKPKPVVILSTLALIIILTVIAGCVYALSPAEKEDNPTVIDYNQPTSDDNTDPSDLESQPAVVDYDDPTSNDTISQPEQEAVPAELPAISLAAPLKDEHTVSAAFGKREIGTVVIVHDGIDYKAEADTPIYAAADGTVISSGLDKGYGLLVKIDHGNDIQTWYAHCKRLLVEEGATVKQGDHIANVGTTGRSTGNHLHFEVRDQGNSIDPASLLS